MVSQNGKIIFNFKCRQKAFFNAPKENVQVPEFCVKLMGFSDFRNEMTLNIKDGPRGLLFSPLLAQS